MPRLVVRNLSCGHDRRVVLEDIGFTLESGELLCVLGPNGAGKSTLFRTLLGLLPALRGEVLLDGVPLARLNERERARLVAYVPQSTHPAFAFSVLDMVLMGRTCRLPAFGRPGPGDRAAALEALEIMGMAALAHRPFTECSGGERQLVLCARALAQGSPVLVMDEPAAGLDFGNALRMTAHLRGLADRGHLLLLSTHNPETALRCADRVLLLHEGRMAGFGKPEALLDEDMVFRLYGVRARRLSVDGGRGAVHVFVP